MSNEKKALPNVQHANDIEDLKIWVRQHGSHIVTAVLIVLIALTALHLLSTRASNRAAEASRRLSTAQSVSDLEGILNDFGKSKVAPLAQLALAKLNFDNGDYEIALSRYGRFLEKWPGHDMQTTAELGRVLCIEARGTKEALQEAAAAFAAFATANPGHFLAPQSLFGQARCHEQLGDLEQARTLYEDFIAANPKSPWSMRAEELLANVQRRIKRTPQA